MEKLVSSELYNQTPSIRIRTIADIKAEDEARRLGRGAAKFDIVSFRGAALDGVSW